MDRVEVLLAWLDELKTELGIPLSTQAYGIDEAAFLSNVDEMAVKVFDDQCTGANPRYPLINELRDVVVDSEGPKWSVTSVPDPVGAARIRSTVSCM